MPPQRLKTIVKLFEKSRYRYDIYSLFSDFCECAAISLSNAVDLAQREAREARYLEIVKRYDRETLETFPSIFAELTLCLEAGFSDVLGATFHALELHNKHAGQFFTPFEVCRLMARMQVSPEGIEAAIGERGYLSAHEPAVGAGALIIALAEAMAEAGFNYQRHLHVTAIDIDRRAVHMAYCQFALLHIPATIIVGDTLRMTQSELWHTPAHILAGWSRKLKTRPGVSPAPEHPAPNQPETGQMVLFS